MPIVLLGLIGVGAALLLVYYSKKPSGDAARAAGARRVQARIVPERQYKKSGDGKVVYLFDEDADEAADRQAAPDDVPPKDGSDGGGEE